MSWLLIPLIFTAICGGLALIEPESKRLIFALWCYLVGPVLIASWSY